MVHLGRGYTGHDDEFHLGCLLLNNFMVFLRRQDQDRGGAPARLLRISLCGVFKEGANQDPLHQGLLAARHNKERIMIT